MRNSKSILVIIIVFASITASGQWTSLNSSTSLNLGVIKQTPSGALLVASSGEAFPPSSGIILKSDNEGATWYIVANNSKGFSDIVFPSQNFGLAIAKSRDTIFRSTDGGNTWQEQYSINSFGSGYGFPQVAFTDSLTGYAPGYKTSDGGNSWVLQNQTLNFFPYVPAGITFLNDSTGVVVGNGYWGVNYKTTDRGVTWSAVIVPYFTWEIYSVYFPTASIGYCTSNKLQTAHETEILKTVDGGDTWTSIYTQSPFIYCPSVFCTDSNTCYAVGSSGTIMKTTDGGVTWGSQGSGTTQTLRKVFFTNADTGYIVGDSGTILKTTNGGGFVGIRESIGDATFKVFPSPAHDELTVENNLNQSVLFGLYNSMGEKIIDKTWKEKINKIDISAVSNGIYFYKITSEKGILKAGKIIKH